MISASTRRRTLESYIGSQSAPPSETGPNAIASVRGFAVPAAGASGAYSVLQVQTRSGITGYGECRPLSRTDLQHLETFIGKPAYAYEALTPLAPEPARGGLNMALLDIVGKMTKAPVYRVLGGPTRFKARAVARLAGANTAEIQADLQRHASTGVRAFLLPIEAPAARNQGSMFVKTHVARFKTLRAAAPEADFAIEARGELTPSDAGLLAAALQPLRPLWFDEPCPITNLDTLRKVAYETVVPLGFGRNIRQASTFQDLLREGLIDLVRPDLLLFGISGVCRVAAMAETYYTAVAPWHEAGPIATMAALHAAATMPNFFVLQVPESGPGFATIHDGFFTLPTAPGLGVTVDIKALERNRIS